MRKLVVSTDLAEQLRNQYFLVLYDREGNALGRYFSLTAEPADSKKEPGKVVVQGELADEFRFGEFLTLCDAAGNDLGEYSPMKPNPDLYWPLEPQISEEELARRAKEGGVYTTEEVLDLIQRGGLGE